MSRIELDRELIEELRRLADEGAPPSLLATVIGRRFGLPNTNFRLLAIAYFREAFALSLADATRIGAASIFPGGRENDPDLDKEVTPLIAATRHLWREDVSAHKA